MKKKLLSLVFALLVMIPCAFLLTACGDDGNYMKIKIVDSHDAGVVGIHLEDADELTSSSSHGYFTWDKDSNYCDSMVPKEKNYIVFIDLKPGYAMGSLTMYVNGEERSLRPLSSALQMIGNPSYIDFAHDDEANVMVDLWTVKADAVDEITITFKGRTELEKYDVQLTSINLNARKYIKNYNDLRFAFSINGEEKLKENATFDDFSAYFAQTSNWINDLIYGDQLIFKVWFEGGIVPFNNAELFSLYESFDGESWYTSCRKSYFDDATGKSVYIFDIYGREKINMFWTHENETYEEYETLDYDKVSLRLTLEGINNSDFTAIESYTFEEIKNKFDNEQNVTFTIPNFKAINAKILQSKFVTLDISYNEITNSEKAQIISYDNEKNVLTLTFNKYTYQYYSGNLIFNDQGEDHDLANKPRLMSDYRDNPNEYLLRFYHDTENLYQNLITDGNWQVTPVIKLAHEYNGTEFIHDYEFEDQSHIHKMLWMDEDVQATVLNDSIMVLDGGDLAGDGITFEMSFDFFPTPTLDENGDYSSRGDLSRFEKITVTVGETKFDITVEEGTDNDPETEEEFTYYYFVTNYDDSIDGLTVYDCTDNDENIYVHSDNVQFVLTDGFINALKPHDTSIKFEYFLKNA